MINVYSYLSIYLPIPITHPTQSHHPHYNPKITKMLNSNPTPPLLLLLTATLLISSIQSISADNACTFHLGGKLFSLLYLQKDKPIKFQITPNQTIYTNLCAAFVPQECGNMKSAYSFAVTQAVKLNIDDNNQTVSEVIYNCSRYSSSSFSHYFSARYLKSGNGGTLEYTLYSEQKGQEVNSVSSRKTVYSLQCREEKDLAIDEYKLGPEQLRIIGKTKYGCPVFQVSSIWQVFQDNWILIGFLLFFVGLHLLFFGRVTIQTTIFVAGFMIIFAILGAVFTVFVGPYSSTFVIYFAFLLLLFASTIIAYGITKLVDISIFFVGAILGFIIGMLVNSLFCKIFNVYSVWSLVIIQILCTIPFGLLSFKHTDQIIIASSSLTGAYFVVRPISWVFGGFPNQFLLYEMVQTKEMSTLPLVFFLYLIVIIALAILGAMYQLIKLRRETPENQLQVNFIQESIEEPIDLIKMKVDKLIQKFKSDKEGEDYRRMSELKDTQGPKRKSAPSSQYPDIEELRDKNEPPQPKSEKIKESDHF